MVFKNVNDIVDKNDKSSLLEKMQLELNLELIIY